jgi:hypothetical protein
MIILGIRVSNVNDVITQFDVIRIYREDAQDASFAGPPIGTIQLVASKIDYEYLDQSGQDTHWYSASYYQTTVPQVESEKSTPFKGIPANGPLGILTPDYIRANTEFPGLAALSDTRLWNYIWRAESLMYSWSMQYGGFCTEGKENWAVMSRIAGLMVVEQLYITTDASSRVRRVSGVKSEKIGSYSYTMADEGTTSTQTTDYNDPYAFGAEPLAILGYYTCGTTSLVHMKTTQVFPELAPIAGYPLTPQYVGVEVRPWHDFTDLELLRGVLLPGGYIHTKDPA